MKKIAKPLKIISATTEMYDIIYNDIMHLWCLLPKDDFWVARQFIDSSISYLHHIKELRDKYEQRENSIS